MPFANHNVVREPENNVYGPYKVLRRADGKYVLHDTRVWPPCGRVFNQEWQARAKAKELTEGVLGK